MHISAYSFSATLSPKRTRAALCLKKASLKVIHFLHNFAMQPPSPERKLVFYYFSEDRSYGQYLKAAGKRQRGRVKMVKFGLQFKATLENVTNVRPLGDDFRWFLKLKCGNCGEVPDKWQYVTLVESIPLKGGRGSASMVQKCKLCARENSIDILGNTITPYNAEDNERFKTMVQFECRGMEPVDFQPQAGFAAQGAESGTPFLEINLQEKDWTDYDEKVSESVGIYEVTHQFIKC